MSASSRRCASSSISRVHGTVPARHPWVTVGAPPDRPRGRRTARRAPRARGGGAGHPHGGRRALGAAGSDRRPGCFVTAIETAVADGRVEAAVHSAKDMTWTMAPGLMLAAVPPRADPGTDWSGAPWPGSPRGLVATGSARRRPNWPTPVRIWVSPRSGEHGPPGLAGRGRSVAAVVVAVAAMERLGWLHRLTDILDPLDLLPQAGQGAIAVQCRSDDVATRALLSVIDDPASHRAVRRPNVRCWPVWAAAAPSGRGVDRARRRDPRCACTVWWPVAMGGSSSG